MAKEQGREPVTLQGREPHGFSEGWALTFEKNYMQNASDPPRQGPYNPPLWSFIARSVTVTDSF